MHAALIAVMLLLSAVLCGCVSESGSVQDTNPSQNQNADNGAAQLTNAGAIVIDHAEVAKKDAFVITSENVICENIVSPKILTGIGMYPMIDFEISTITITPGHETPMHLLKDISESIFVISGSGEMLINDNLIAAEPGTFVHIPMNTPIVYRNSGENDLSFILITDPPYDAANEILSSEKEFETARVNSGNATVIKVEDITPEIFFEDLKVVNLLNPEKLKEYNQNTSIGCGIAYITMPKGSKTDPHLVEGTTEVDYILKGKGEAVVNSKIMTFEAGDTLYIQSGAHQSIANTGSGDLVYLSVTYPPYDSKTDSSVKK